MRTIQIEQQCLGLSFLIGYTSFYYPSLLAISSLYDVGYDGYALPMIWVPILGTIVAIAFRWRKSKVGLPTPNFLGSLFGHAIVYAIILNLFLGPDRATSWIAEKGIIKIATCWLAVIPILAFSGGLLGIGVSKIISGNYLIHAHKVIQYVLAVIAGFLTFNLIFVFLFLIIALLIENNPFFSFVISVFASVMAIRAISMPSVWRIGAYSGSGLAFVMWLAV